LFDFSDINLSVGMGIGPGDATMSSGWLPTGMVATTFRVLVLTTETIDGQGQAIKDPLV
jgi:hypothetical protein